MPSERKSRVLFLGGDIADYLGLTVETVSRVFSKFRKQGLIDLEQCILVTLLDTETLTEIADGNFD